MKPQVLTNTTSDPSISEETRAPLATRVARIFSESTVFLSQPKVINAILGPCAGPTGLKETLASGVSRGTSGRTGSNVNGKTGRSLLVI